MLLPRQGPTPSNYIKTPTAEYTDFKLKDTTQTNRDMYPTQMYPNRNEQLDVNLTQTGNSLPEENVRLDTCILNALLTNPYHVPLIWGEQYGYQPQYQRTVYEGYQEDKQNSQQIYT